MTIIKIHNSTWEDVNELVDALSTKDEKVRVLSCAVKLENKHNSIVWPRTAPNSNYNNKEHSGAFSDAKTTHYDALQQAAQQLTNWKKFHDTPQNLVKYPDVFCICLCIVAQKFAQLDSENECDLKAIISAYDNQLAAYICDYFHKFCPG